MFLMLTDPAFAMVKANRSLRNIIRQKLQIPNLRVSQDSDQLTSPEILQIIASHVNNIAPGANYSGIDLVKETPAFHQRVNELLASI